MECHPDWVVSYHSSGSWTAAKSFAVLLPGGPGSNHVRQLQPETEVPQVARASHKPLVKLPPGLPQSRTDAQNLPACRSSDSSSAALGQEWLWRPARRCRYNVEQAFECCSTRGHRFPPSEVHVPQLGKRCNHAGEERQAPRSRHPVLGPHCPPRHESPTSTLEAEALNS
jgi:hypothetical protein